MLRKLEKNNIINNWTINSGPIEKEGRNYYILNCNVCKKDVKFNSAYINRSNFSKQCRSCSQKIRRKETGKYVINTRNQNLIIIGEPHQYKSNTYYKVKCDCGHIYHTGHSTFSRKERLPYCSQCFNVNKKRLKRNTMLTENISKSIFNRLMMQAKLRGMRFELDPNYLETLLRNQNFKCALSGIDINISPSFSKKESRILNTASLDRINSFIGYIKGNVQWVYKKINTMKSNFNQDEFLELCKKNK